LARTRRKLLDPKKVVCVDESSGHQHFALAPLYGWVPKGERAYGRAPRNWGKNITLIASLSVQGVEAAMSVEGTTEGAAFETSTGSTSWCLYPQEEGGRSYGDG
jgi:hypothetical protein